MAGKGSAQLERTLCAKLLRYKRGERGESYLSVCSET